MAHKGIWDKGILLQLFICQTFTCCSYRGYGLSSGQPNEAGLKVDAQTGLEALLQRPDINPEKVVVYGRSLGGAVAIHLTAANSNKVHKGGEF
jgi:fermentation-respiration switch protein FrsA (DUF1100 family)